MSANFVPQTSYRDFAPGPHWGTSILQAPWAMKIPGAAIGRGAERQRAIALKATQLIDAVLVRYHIRPVFTRICTCDEARDCSQPTRITHCNTGAAEAPKMTKTSSVQRNRATRPVMLQYCYTCTYAYKSQ